MNSKKASETSEMVSKKSASSYLHNDVSDMAQVESTKRVIEEVDDQEEEKKDSTDQVQRKAERKAIRIGNRALTPKFTDKPTENIKKIEKIKSGPEMQFIINCLKQHFVFYNLSLKEL